MKKYSRGMGICAAVTASLLFVSVVCAQPRGADFEGKTRYRQERISKIVDTLGLTEEQRDALKEKRVGHRAQMKELGEALRTKRKELQEELEKAQSDTERISTLVSDIKSLQGELLDQRVAGILATKEILTPEQLEEMHSIEGKKMRRGGRKENKGSHLWHKKLYGAPDE